MSEWDCFKTVNVFGVTIKPRNGTSETQAERLRIAAAMLGKKGGKVKSQAKQIAAQENGKKGGRPKFLDVKEPAKLPLELHEYQRALCDTACEAAMKRGGDKTIVLKASPVTGVISYGVIPLGDAARAGDQVE